MWIHRLCFYFLGFGCEKNQTNKKFLKCVDEEKSNQISAFFVALFAKHKVII